MILSALVMLMIVLHATVAFAGCRWMLVKSGSAEVRDAGVGKSAHYSRHPKYSQNCLISVELVLLYMFHTIFLMGNNS